MKKILTVFMLVFLTSQLCAKMILCNVNRSKQINCYWSAGDCTTKPPGVDYCFNVDHWTNAITQGRALVLVDDQNNAAVQVEDNIVNILPDFLDSLIRINKLDEINNVEPIKISTKVSKKRIEEIAKELGIKVTKVKKLPKANYCPACEEAEKKKNEKDATIINPFESVIIEMVCDCNPSQVLSTFVTDANGGVKITVPKDANYSFKLVIPPVLKEKGIKVADLANNVVVNFSGAKNIENLSFNNKGIVSAKNLQQGNYEIALSRKPPKGPKGSSEPPRGKCPPGETPWLGGCIPIVVVSGVNKVKCPVGTVMTQFGCMDIKNPGKEPEIPRPDGFPSPNKEVAINCPTGKYDANGNCIFASPNSTQKNPLKFSIFSIDAGYLVSANAENNKDNKPLFAGNGLSAGLNYRYGSRLGVTGRIGYASGSRNESNLKEFASTLTKAPWVYKISGFTKTWSQFNFAAGPSIFLGKQYKGELSAIVGVSTGSQSNIKIDLYDAAVFYKNVYNVTEKKSKLFWEVGGSYSFAKISKRSVFGIKGSYGSAGGSFGLILSITEQVCVGAPCFRCQGAGCLGEMPKPGKPIY